MRRMNDGHQRQRQRNQHASVLHKQYGSLVATLLVDRAAPVSAFVDAISVAQSIGIDKFVLVSQSTGPDTDEATAVAAAKRRTAELEAQMKQLEERTKGTQANQK